MAWELEETAKVPNCGETRTCKMTDGEVTVVLYGWLQGCGLNALQNLSGLRGLPASAWPEFRDTLAATRTNLGLPGCDYDTKRWMFTATDAQLCYASDTNLFGQLIKASRLIDSFKNQSHGSQTIHMYFLEF